MNWHCNRCPWTGETRDGIVAAFHRCVPGRAPDLSLVGSLPDDLEERNQLWATLLFGPGKDPQVGGRESDGNAA